MNQQHTPTTLKIVPVAVDEPGPEEDLKAIILSVHKAIAQAEKETLGK